MIDSRLDTVAALIVDAQGARDQSVKSALVHDAAMEYRVFADEFPVTDSLVQVVRVRLEVAAKNLQIGDAWSAGLSLQLAGNAIRSLQNR